MVIVMVSGGGSDCEGASDILVICMIVDGLHY